MPRVCSASDCKNSYSRAFCEKKISFHKFPIRNRELLDKWLSRLNIEGFEPNENSIICSQHFEDQCYEILPISKRLRLKDDAEPTIFSNTTVEIEKRVEPLSFNKNMRVKIKKKNKKKHFSNLGHSSGIANFQYGESLYEQRIADLKENNKVLSLALESSYKTIELQDKTILDLRKRIVSQVPKLLKMKLQVIGRTLKQLLEVWEEASELIDNPSIEDSSDVLESRTFNGLAELAEANESNHVGLSFRTSSKSSKKKHKKKSTKNSESPSTASPEQSLQADVPKKNNHGVSKKTKDLPSTSGASSDTASKKKVSKSSKKKRKIDDLSSSEEDRVGAFNSDDEQSSSDETLAHIIEAVKIQKHSENGAKKLKKDSVVVATEDNPAIQKKRSPLVIKIKPKPKPKPKKKVQKITTNAAVASDESSPITAVVKTEQLDLEETCTLVDNASSEIPQIVLSSSSDSSDVSAASEETPRASSSTSLALSFNAQPKVILSDIMKDPKKKNDPIVSRYKERLMNGSYMNGISPPHLDAVSEVNLVHENGYEEDIKDPRISSVDWATLPLPISFNEFNNDQDTEITVLNNPTVQIGKEEQMSSRDTSMGDDNKEDVLTLEEIHSD